MITETGEVVAIEEDGLWVETLKQSACSQCAAKAGCGQKLLADKLPGAEMTFIKALYSPTSRNESWHLGDKAVLGIEESALVKGALLAYLVPLVAMVLGASLAHQIFLSELLSVFGAVLGLLVGGLWVRHHSRQADSQSTYQPVVIAKVISNSL